MSGPRTTTRSPRTAARRRGTLITAVAGAMLLAGCSAVAERATESAIERMASNAGADVDIDRSTGGFRVEGEGGSLAVDPGGEIPEAIRDALTLPADIEVAFTSTLLDNGNSIVSFSGFLVRDDLAALVTEVTDAITAAGWTVINTYSVGTDIQIVSAARDDQQLEVAMTPAPGRPGFDLVINLVTNAG
jgi:hypothetical protein